MKKSILKICMLTACAGLFVSCASENDEVSEAEKARVNQIMADMSANSDVVVSLSGNSSATMMTRASVEADKNGYFKSDDPFGVFMLANHTYDNSILTNDDIDWSGKGAGKTIYNAHYADVWSVWKDINNITTYAEPMKNAQGDTLGTQMTWYDHQVRYYPYNCPFAYSFFAYHPQVANSNVTWGKDEIVANITLDGSKDLLWGCISSDSLDQADTTTTYAYSAKYFHYKENRASADTAKAVPMTFHHYLARLKFNIIAGGLQDADTTSFEAAKSIKIKSIAISNTYKQAKLVVASRDASTAGKLEWTDSRDKTLTLNLTNYPSPRTKIVDGVEVADTFTVDGDIMVPPIKSTDDPYKVMVTVTTKDNQEVSMVIPMILKLDGNAELKAGYSYTVNLKLYAPEPIMVSAAVDEWQKGGVIVADQQKGEVNVIE